MHEYKGTPNIGKRWGPPLAIEAWLHDMTPRNTPLPTCYLREFGRSRSNGTKVIKEIRLKKLTPRVPPFKVIGTDTDLSRAYDVP